MESGRERADNLPEAKEPRPSDTAFPVHPLFVAAFPVLSLFSSNLAIVPLEDLWRPLGISVLAAFALWLILWPLFRSLRRAAVAASVFVALTFLFSTIGPKLAVVGYPSVWLILSMAIACFAAFKLRQTALLNLVAILLAVVAGGSIVYSELKIDLDESRVHRAVASRIGKGGTYTPDIFYIILDGYGREDALKRAIHFDNASFVDALRTRGFYVADRSHSNYVQTEISLSSSLNLELIPTLLPNKSRTETDRKVFDDLISKNELSSFLEGMGYRTIGITSGFPPVTFPYDDVWLQDASKLSLFETTLIQMTPLVPRGSGLGSMFVWRRHALMAAFKNLRELAETAGRPRFVFVHILAPHPPFVLNAQEGYARPRGPFGYWDGSDYTTYVGNRDTYRAGYSAQVQAINAEVLKTVDAIIGKAKIQPIIVIQGDHGSKVGLDQNDLSKTDVTECFENLEAFYGPPSVLKNLYPTITPVNEFRVILNSLFGTGLALEPDRSWYSPFAYPFDFSDVTAKVMETPTALGPTRSAMRSRHAKGAAEPFLGKG